MFIERQSVEPFDFGGLSIRDYTAGFETRSSFAIIEVPPFNLDSEVFIDAPAGRGGG